MGGVDVLSSRVLLRPTDADRSQAFYRDVLGLAVYREFGPPGHRGLVFFLGNGLLEVSGHADERPRGLALWVQVRDLAAAHRELLARRVDIVREPRREPWGLDEMWLADPDGIEIRMVEVPPEHHLRRDPRPWPGPPHPAG